MTEQQNDNPEVMPLPPAVPTFHASVSYVAVIAYDFTILLARPRPMLRTDNAGIGTNAQMQPVALTYLSPTAAKTLAKTLTAAVSEYESQFGEIPLPASE